MLKRIAIIAFFTGSGQVLSLLVLKFISLHSDVAQLKSVAEIDSLVLFIMNIIGLGLQSAAMRNLSQSSDWKQEYYDTQSARITLGLLLMGAAVLYFLNPYYLIFLAAPVLAWSGDYALYARGFPIAGSMIAFIRLAIPFSSLLLAALYYPSLLAWVYAVSLVVVYFITNAYISYYLGTSYLFRPSFRKLRLYIQSLPLGIVVLSMYFLGLGLLLVIPYFYNEAMVAVAFVGLKLYMIFKGILRIVHQAFIKEMESYEVCFRVDQFCCLLGLAFASFAICFPNSFIRLFFGEKYLPEKMYFMLLASAALIYSLFSSLTIKALLEHKDKSFSVIATGAASLTILLCIIFSQTWPGATDIGVSLLIGEVAFAAGMLWLMRHAFILRQRAMFLLKNLLLPIIPFAVRYFWGDSTNPFIVAMILFGGVTALLYYRKFNLSPDSVN